MCRVLGMITHTMMKGEDEAAYDALLYYDVEFDNFDYGE
jgi:hypothetical protein